MINLSRNKKVIFDLLQPQEPISEIPPPRIISGVFRGHYNVQISSHKPKEAYSTAELKKAS
jgi:hypothetical protein